MKSLLLLPTLLAALWLTAPFHSALSAEEADPFLMCDYFQFKSDTEPSKDPDHFPVDWHPHRGMSMVFQ